VIGLVKLVAVQIIFKIIIVLLLVLRQTLVTPSSALAQQFAFQQVSLEIPATESASHVQRPARLAQERHQLVPAAIQETFF
jgi:hypothetical protein